MNQFKFVLIMQYNKVVIWVGMAENVIKAEQSAIAYAQANTNKKVVRVIQKATLFKVLKNKKFTTGIIETNYHWAKIFWNDISSKSEDKFTLELFDTKEPLPNKNVSEYIEISKAAFDRILGRSCKPYKEELKELVHKAYYLSYDFKLLELYNYVSKVTQYYIQDINY